MIETTLILSIAAALAYANGANDVSKGTATLVAAGLAGYRRAILWGTVWTAAGGAVATVAAGAMLQTFGQGLLLPGGVPALVPALGALAGAAAWVLIATRTGLPVSTTHALVGAAIGSSVAAYGAGSVAWTTLAGKVALPLAASPLVALVAARIVFGGVTRILGPAAVQADCVCLTVTPVAPAIHAAPRGAALLATAETWFLPAIHAETCRASRSVTRGMTVDRVHWLSSGAVSFARGMNDAPKIVALAMATAALAPTMFVGGIGRFYALVIAGMVLGGLVAGRRVTRVLAEDVTPMDHRQGLSANVATAALVTAGAMAGWPMSTTHVSTGGIAGVGSAAGTVAWRKVGGIGLAWVVTLPGAAVLAAAAAWLLGPLVP